MIRWLQAISAASILLITIPLAAADWERKLLEGDAARRQGDYRTAVQEFKALLAVP